MIQLDIPTNDNGDHSQKRGDLIIRGFFKPETDVIVDVQIINLSAPTYRGKTAESVLRNAEVSKKRKYKHLCEQQRRTFVPFIMSACGILGNEANNFLRRLALLWSEKFDEPQCRSRQFINTRLDISLIRSCNLCIRGSRVPRVKNSKSRSRYLPYSHTVTPPGDFLFLSD